MVNPYDYSVQGTASPEGQAFVLEMVAAWRDWQAIEKPSVSAATKNVGLGWVRPLVVATGLQLVLQRITYITVRT